MVAGPNKAPRRLFENSKNSTFCSAYLGCCPALAENVSGELLDTKSSLRPGTFASDIEDIEWP